VVSSIFFLLLSFFFSSPNVSRRRLDVYHTRNTGHKKSPSRHHRTTLSGYIFAIKARIDNRKKVLNSNTSSTCPDNMVNFGPLAGEIDRFGSLGHPCKCQRVSRLGNVRPTTRHSSSRRQPNFATLNRGRHLYSAGRPPLGIGPHSSLFFSLNYFVLALFAFVVLGLYFFSITLRK